MYQDRLGNLHNAQSCQTSLIEYKKHDIKDMTQIYIPYRSFSKKLTQLVPRKIRAILRKII